MSSRASCSGWLRGQLLSALATAASILGCGGAPESPRGPQPEAASDAHERRPDPKDDPRIDYLLVLGARSDHYDVDTSDTLGILSQMLLHGQRDPLRRAREELGAAGADGLRVAQRVIDLYFEDPQGGAHLRNAIDVVHRSNHPDARRAALQLVRHRDPGVATLAMAALEKHGKPEDYDAVRARFDDIDPEFKLKTLHSAWRLDARRSDLEFIDWLQHGKLDGLWDEFAALLSEAEAPEVIGRLSAMWRDAAPRCKALLAAPCARAGDSEALAFLRTELEAGELWRKEAAVAALQRAKFEPELVEVARSSPSTVLRSRAINALVELDATQRHVDVLRANATSVDSALANACLGLLVRMQDPAALDRAIAALEGSDSEAFQTAISALREVMHANPELARRVYGTLCRRREPEAHMPLGDQVRTLQALGQVPLEESARALLELSRGAVGEIAGLPAERWLVQQAGNVGIAGQRLLAKELDSESDPARRVDLIEGLAIQGGPLALTLLARFIESDGARPYEILYTADRLIRIGTVEEIAPLLKRVALRVQQADVRLALQSMLWSSYPAPH